ncbi:MAG: dihydropteroate synthase [Candidatus Tantalella remota]|nr:dihydropteroate synthase [Candidatus Tantalella remota]
MIALTETVKRTRVMGVLNVTPDSFSDGGMYLEADAAVDRAVIMAEAGADIIDVGGESSRPGSWRISVDEELARVVPVIEGFQGKIEIPVSIDTYKSEVARHALAAGASFVNDITALNGDPKMVAVAADADAGVVLMHMRGMPGDMQKDPEYDDVVEDVVSYLSKAVLAAERAGIDPGKIIVDPGIGFGKTLDHNLALLRGLGRIKEIGKPVLIGTSRKSFIGMLTGKDPENRLPGTAASIAAGIMNGADIVRAHDVGEMIDVVRVIDAIKGEI